DPASRRAAASAWSEALVHNSPVDPSGLGRGQDRWLHADHRMRDPWVTAPGVTTPPWWRDLGRDASASSDDRRESPSG
ncbi:MAG: hypothetical protein ABI859_14280, partial [Pseudomonadota bacterium]